jgi:hypothetical protein
MSYNDFYKYYKEDNNMMITWFMSDTLKIATAIMSIIALIIAYKTYRSNKKTKRPTMSLKGIYLSPKEVASYVGCNVSEWDCADDIVSNEKRKVKNPILTSDTIETEKRKNYNYAKDYVLHEERQWKVTVLNHDKKDYMFVNLCERDITSSKQLILMFGALKLSFEFSNIMVDEIIVKKVFSMINDKTSFGEEQEINVRIPISETEFDLSIAYACKDGRPTSLNLRNIYLFSISDSKDTINFLENKNLAGEYINFSETGYLLQCNTIDDETYYYSLYVKIDTNTGYLVKTQLHNGKRLFYKKAKEACRNANKDVVQYAVKNPENKEKKKKAFYSIKYFMKYRFKK